MTVDPYHGLCPDCGNPGEAWLNVRAAHYVVCHTDRTRWLVGENLFSGWRSESPGDWIANAIRIGDYEEVDPVYVPDFVPGGEVPGA